MPLTDAKFLVFIFILLVWGSAVDELLDGCERGRTTVNQDRQIPPQSPCRSLQPRPAAPQRNPGLALGRGEPIPECPSTGLRQNRSSHIPNREQTKQVTKRTQTGLEPAIT